MQQHHVVHYKRLRPAQLLVEVDDQLALQVLELLNPKPQALNPKLPPSLLDPSRDWLYNMVTSQKYDPFHPKN